MDKLVRHAAAVVVLMIFGVTDVAVADDVSILGGGAVKSALVDSFGDFEKASGHKVRGDFAPMGALTPQAHRRRHSRRDRCDDRGDG